MTEKNSAGAKELIFALLWAAGLITAYDLCGTAMRLYGAPGGANMALTICTVAVGCVMVYLALTRYAAVYTYSIGAKSVRLTRKIGHRERTLEIRNRDIISFSDKKPEPFPKRAVKMKKTVFSEKNARYLIYRDGDKTAAAVFEPSRKMAAEISARVKIKEG